MDKEFTETVSPQDKKIERKSFIFFRSYADALFELPDERYVRVSKALLRFALDGEEPDLKGEEKAIFLLMKPVILDGIKKYENGRKGGRPKSISEDNQEESKPEPTETKPKSIALHDKDMELDNVIDKDLDNNSAASPQKGKKFKPPTLMEVETYCAERGLQIDAERFIDYYASNGWRVGKSPMKDWQAAVRNWVRRDISAPTDRANPDRAALPDSGNMSKYYS